MRTEFADEIKPIFTSEPWHMIVEKYSKEHDWLRELHGKIKSKLEQESIAKSV